MLQILFGVFVVMHGLVHFWPFALSRRLIEYKPEMGWTGESWLFTPIIGDSGARWVASVLYVLAAIAFVVSAMGLFASAPWWRIAMVASSIFSAVVILSFWDGRPNMIVEKGLAGFIIDAAIVLLVLVIKWPAG